MADLAHLEKMGRELKCPICSTLLKSAAFLGCNHIFCNVCISGSMRSVSNCPVCKIPFHRRVADMSWRAYRNFGAENFYVIPTFNQYWAGGVSMGGDGYMAPFNGAMPYMCLTTGPFDAPSSRIPPQEPFSAQGSMMPSFAQSAYHPIRFLRFFS